MANNNVKQHRYGLFGAILPRRITGICGLVASVLLSACAPTTPNWDARFGESVRQAIALQTLNPDASRNTNPVSGIDGHAAKDAVSRYQKSFVEKEPHPGAFTIGVSGGR